MRSTIYSRQQATNKIEQQKRNQKRRRFIINSSLLALGLSLLLCIGLKIMDPATFPIKSIKITGNYSHVDHQALQDAILPYMNKGFLWLDVNGLKEELVQIPWVATADVKRIWPNVLQINITERTPIAHWNNNELMTSDGVVFNANGNIGSDNLPWLSGPPGQQENLLADYQFINQMLAPVGVHAVWIALTPRQAFELKLNNNMLLVIGKNDVVSRLQRFVSVYNTLFRNHENDVAYVDLRYSNGLAVRWKNNTNTPTASPPELTE